VKFVSFVWHASFPPLEYLLWLIVVWRRCR